MTEYARPIFGRRRWGLFWWKTFKWNDKRICPISVELAENVGWKISNPQIVMGPYRLKVVSADPHLSTIYGMRISGQAEEFLRRIYIFITDILASLFGKKY